MYEELTVSNMYSLMAEKITVPMPKVEFYKLAEERFGEKRTKLSWFINKACSMSGHFDIIKLEGYANEIITPKYQRIEAIQLLKRIENAGSLVPMIAVFEKQKRFSKDINDKIKRIMKSSKYITGGEIKEKLKTEDDINISINTVYRHKNKIQSEKNAKKI